MEPLRTLTERLVPLGRSDVDTDAIIPAEWLKRLERSGFGAGLFERWRAEPDFVLNQSAYQDARILLAGPKFGIGSSREHAVWALTDYGFRAVISPSFADIFFANCTKNGLLPVTLPTATVDSLLEAVRARPDLVVTVDVVDLRVTAPAIDLDEPFHLEPFVQKRFLQGLDDISLTLRHEDAIAAAERSRPSWTPRSTVVMDDPRY